MALKKRESIFKTWTDGGEVNDSNIEGILAGVTGDKAPEAKSLKYSKKKFSSIYNVVSNDVHSMDKNSIKLAVLENMDTRFANYFEDSRGDKSLRSPDFYDKYLEKEKLPSVIACNYIYDFCKNNFDVLEKESKNYGTLKTLFTHDEIYIENLKSYINDVTLFARALRNIATEISSVNSQRSTSGYYLNLYKTCFGWAQLLDKQIRTNPNASVMTTEISNSNLTNAAECFMFLSMLKASCEAFSELGKKIEVIRTKFNKIFNKARDLQKKFDDSHVSKKLEVGEAMDTEAGYLPKDSKTVKIGKPFRKKAAVLSSVSSSQYTGSLDPEHNIKHKCFEICKATIIGLENADYDSLTATGADKLSAAVPACFGNLLEAEKDGFCIDYEAKIATTVKDCTSEEIFCEYKTIFDSLKTIIQPFVDSQIAKASVAASFTINNFECKDLKKFMFAVEQLRKLKYNGKEILVYKYTKIESKDEQDLTVEVTLNDSLKDFLTNFSNAVTAVNTLLDNRSTFLKETFSKTWVLDKASIDDISNLKNGKIEKAHRNLNDLEDDGSLTTKTKNIAKKTRNAFVGDIQCNATESVPKKPGRLPDAADRRVFPSLEYKFIVVNSSNQEIIAANHDGRADSTISEKTGVKDAKAIANDIYHMAKMSRAYGVWANLDDHDWKKYEGNMKNRYIDFKDPFRA